MERTRWGIRPTVAAVTAAAALSWFGIGAAAYAEEAVDVTVLGGVAAEELVPVPAGQQVMPEIVEGALGDSLGPDAADADEGPLFGEGMNAADAGDPSDDVNAPLNVPEQPATEGPVEEGGVGGESPEQTEMPEVPGDAEQEGSQDEGTVAPDQDAAEGETPAPDQGDANGETPAPDQGAEEGEGPAAVEGDPAAPADGPVVEDPAVDVSDSVAPDALAPDLTTDATEPEGSAEEQPAVSVEAAAPMAVQKAPAAKPAQTGWVERDGKRYYYNAEGKPVSGSQQIDGKWYYFDAAKGGAMATGLVEEVKADGSKAVYYQGSDGARKMGEVELDRGWYYFDPAANGARVQSSFVQLNGAYLDNGPKTVYYGSDGKMVHGEQQVGSDWYYLDPIYGSRAQNRFVNLTGAYLTWGPKTVYYGAEGAMVYGEQEVGGAWYYLDYERGGDRAHDRFVYLNGAYLDNGPKTVYYGSDGKMVYGEQEVQGGWYYLDPIDGNRAHDRYVLLSGAYLDKGPKMVYYGSDGKMLHGTHTIDGAQRFFDYSTGAVNKLGWQNPKGLFQVSAHNVVLPSQAYGTGFDYVTPSRITLESTRDECIEAFIGRAYEYMGTPYVWDYALAPGVGVDCAGLVMQCLYATGMDLGDTTPMPTSPTPGTTTTPTTWQTIPGSRRSRSKAAVAAT